MTEMNCEVLVLGGGGAGLVAGARAAWHGKKVIVLEKTRHTGGGAQFASAIRTFRSKWQKERNLPDEMEAFITQGMDATYWQLDERLIRNVCEGTGKFFDWFCEMAPEKVEQFEVGTYVFDGPNGPKVPLLKGSRSHYGSGKVTMETMREVCERYGAQVLLESRAVDAEVESGYITAIIAKTAEGWVRISCEACILATGSWVSNSEVVAKVMPAFLDVELDKSCYAHCSPTCTGDGLPIAEKAGAKLDYDNFCLRLMGPCVLNPSRVLNSIGNSGYQVGINLKGRRWSAEPIQRRMGLFKAGHVLIRQPKGLSYSVFDENNLRAAFERAHTPNNGYEGFFGRLDFPDTMEESRADIMAEVEKKNGSAFCAQTLAELAEQIGLPAQALQDTIARYNRACAEGNDEFFKEPAEMVPLTQPPFYAVRGRIGSDGGFGGVQVDPQMRVYRADGTVVEGFYAAGDLAGGRHVVLGDFKEQVINDCSWAFAGGFLAADHACSWLDGAKSEKSVK